MNNMYGSENYTEQNDNMVVFEELPFERERVEEISVDGKTFEENAEEKDEEQDIYDKLEKEIMNSDMSDREKTECLSRLLKIRGKKVNIMLTGSTGSGKSSTINALFNMDMAKVGVGVDPETDSITNYQLDNLTVWDTPGLGDNVEKDEKIVSDIVRKLSELDCDEKPIIDMVVVVLDASTKDLRTVYDLINDVLIPCFGDEAEKRILVALNQSDIAMKGTHWDSEKNEPDETLTDFLKKKVQSIRQRIKEGTGLDVTPIYYCAGYKEEGGEQLKPYNLTKLLYYIVQSVPGEKRLALVDKISDEEDNWIYDDEEEDYKEALTLSYTYSIGDFINEGEDTGMEIGGKILGIPGRFVGGLIGVAVGAVRGIFDHIFNNS